MPRWENMKFEAWKYISSFSAATNFFFPPKFLKPEWAEFEVVWRQKWKLFERQKLSKVGGDVTTKAKESRSWAFGSYLMESWISFGWKISPWSKTWYSNGCYLKWNGSVLKSSSSSNLCRFANTRCFFIQQFGASLEWIRINNGNHTLLIPPIMLACTDFLSTPDCLETEGIFRRSANAALVKELQVTKLYSFYLDVPGQGSSKTD